MTEKMKRNWTAAEDATGGTYYGPSRMNEMRGLICIFLP
jgi:hypothetical protein